jgi:hypothetical protein
MTDLLLMRKDPLSPPENLAVVHNAEAESNDDASQQIPLQTCTKRIPIRRDGA